MAENRCNLKLLLAGVFSPVPAGEQLLLFRAGAHLRANSKETLGSRCSCSIYLCFLKPPGLFI